MSGQQEIKAVILDLDGTILDTETLCISVAKEVLEGYNATLTLEACKACLGKRPLESWQALVDALSLKEPGNPSQPACAERLLNVSEPLLQARWGEARLLPGALRLLRYLKENGIPFAIATSTLRATLNAKLSTKPELRELLQHAVCGDEVANGKPAPDTFLAAARLMGLPVRQEGSCLVIEDAPSGVQGALAAGMQVLLVPSMRDELQAQQPPGVTMIPSLLALQPQQFALPPFTDTIHDMIPQEPLIYIKGEVVRGFGRGSKELGIPTANVAAEALSDCLADAVTGIWAGWASVGTSHEVHKMVMSIGYNPFFGNTVKTAEPWILSDFPSSFYGQELRLVVTGYIRPEANFTSLQALVERIHEDANVTSRALDHPLMQAHSSDPWLVPGQSAHALAAAAATADAGTAEN